MDTITISGYAFTVPSPFAEGHVCTEAEAQVLNRAMHANLRRNFARRVEEVARRAPPMSAEIAELQAELDSLASSYRFGGPDPSEFEALVIAEQIVRQALRNNKKNITDFSREQLTDQAKALLASPRGGEIRRLANERTKMIRQAAAQELRRVENGQ